MNMYVVNAGNGDDYVVTTKLFTDKNEAREYFDLVCDDTIQMLYDMNTFFRIIVKSEEEFIVETSSKDEYFVQMAEVALG